jgi:ATP-dependent DNA helicase HFM1/MER3
VPLPGRTVFTEFQQFNPVQSAVLPALLHSDCSVGVTAPTGSGKTVLLELAVLRLVGRAAGASPPRALYLAPVRALCAERCRDWTAKFGPLGLRVLLLTGDSKGDDLAEVAAHQLIIATPEKWDAVSRRLHGHRAIMESVRLVMVDEAHLLSDPARGHVLEAVLTRLKMLRADTRFVAVSATFPNIKDMACWLGGADAKVFKVGFFLDIDVVFTISQFGDSYRPVVLRKVVRGFPYYKVT